MNKALVANVQEYGDDYVVLNIGGQLTLPVDREEVREVSRYDEMALARIVRHLRERAGLTKTGVAEKIGCSYHWVGNVEKGARKSPDIRLLAKLSRLLAGDPLYLISVYIYANIEVEGEVNGE